MGGQHQLPAPQPRARQGGQYSGYEQDLQTEGLMEEKRGSYNPIISSRQDILLWSILKVLIFLLFIKN